MTAIRPLSVCALVALLSAGAADARTPYLMPVQLRTTDTPFPCVRAGQCVPLGDIIARTNIQVRGQYLGSEYDAESFSYRLKYMRSDRTVVWVDVDARTGRMLRVVGE